LEGSRSPKRSAGHCITSRLQYCLRSSSPELFLDDGALDLSLGNTRLLAGLIAILVAWFSKNTLITILAGMLALFLLKIFL
jgi:hypothetical protein